MTNPVQLVLSNFASSVQMDFSATFQNKVVPTFDSSATAILQVSVSAMQSCFQYNTSSSEVKYYVNSGSFPTLNPANAMMDASGSKYPIATSDGGQTLAANKMMVAHDFVRYLSLRLFNTPYATDLFNNTDVLLTDLRYLCDSSSGHVWGNIKQSLAEVSTTSGNNPNIQGSAGSYYMTNADTTSANLCRELFLQLFNLVPTRFQDIGGNQNTQNIPFIAGDSISFKLNISPANGQQNLTGVVPIESRSYEIRLIMVSGTPSNTAVDTAENVALY
jgi:hypothetical protein